PRSPVSASTADANMRSTWCTTCQLCATHDALVASVATDWKAHHTLRKTTATAMSRSTGKSLRSMKGFITRLIIVEHLGERLWSAEFAEDAPGRCGTLAFMPDVTIVGAGLAGLCCAVRLEQAGMSVKLLEAEDAPGGRIRTDQVEGFRLDRGFQILLTGYPELAEHIDVKALRLRPLSKGALVWHGGRFHHFADPFRGSLGNALSIAMDPVITMGDKLRVARLRRLVNTGEPANLFRRREISTRQFLEEYGFSPKIIDRFFTPFLAGVFLERELVTSSRYFQFLFRMF